MTSGTTPHPEADSTTRRIAAVVEDTGLSKELIHHYLRQGLLPKPESRAQYGDQHVRLLNLIRTLREEHFLPLEVIREVFEIFRFDPDRLESIAVSESLGTRLSRFAVGRNLLPSDTLQVEDLIANAGITGERLEEYLQARLVTPESNGSQQRFSTYDRNVIALCERGIRLGIPFESFRTIGSYVRVAFELEHAEFFTPNSETMGEGEQILEDLFLRSEVVASFIQNMLSAVSAQHFRDVLGRPEAKTINLDEIVFRPSTVFLRRHRIEANIEAAREELCAQPDEVEGWRNMAAVLLHAGRYHEAAFFSSEALEKWPSDVGARSLHGRALVLSSEHERGQAQLARVESEDVLAGLFVVLSRYVEATEEDRPESLLRQAGSIVRRIDGLLSNLPQPADPVRIETQAFAGWLLTALPQLFCQWNRGFELMLCSLRELEELSALSPQGTLERLKINTGYLLFESLTRWEKEQPAEVGEDLLEDIPSLEELSTTVYRLDPGCRFTEALFLGEGPDVETNP